MDLEDIAVFTLLTGAEDRTPLAEVADEAMQLAEDKEKTLLLAEEKEDTPAMVEDAAVGSGATKADVDEEIVDWNDDDA
ncbi:hypothetical protein EW146_g1488 [Bondarzewia mesenterica]|uniref:Uncharacterized protein n=1 Tax=Bondarzewia mesenterica TaxID=1095465 RepID=A0A4V3XG16_9AGAM|nr:hypothetical protein EW146_g1488 [Bondarzewia mesenterica]